MLVNDKDAEARLNNPMNLINRLASLREKKSNPMHLFTGGASNEQTIVRSEPGKPLNIPSSNLQIPSFNPFQSSVSAPIPAPIPPILPPDESAVKQGTVVEDEIKLDDLIDNADTKIKLSTAHKNALDLLGNSITALSTKLDNVNVNKLPSVIAAANKVISSIRSEIRETNKEDKEREVHYHFYTPIQKKLTDYEVKEV